MKNFLKLTGVQILSKKEQKEIDGGLVYRPYCGGHNRCCVTTASGFEFCDYGYCYSPGVCVWA